MNFMNIKHYLILVASILFVSCATQKPIPSAPQVRESVVPTIVQVEENSERLKEAVASQKEIIREQQDEIDASIRLAETLREQMANLFPESDSNEAQELVDLLNSVKARNMFLERTNTELNDQIIEGQKLLIQARELAKSKDQESIEWQESFSEIRDQNISLQKDLEKQKARAAKADVYRKWVIGLAIGAIAWLIIKNILMVYFPASAFLKRV